MYMGTEFQGRKCVLGVVLRQGQRKWTLLHHKDLIPLLGNKAQLAPLPLSIVGSILYTVFLF